MALTWITFEATGAGGDSAAGCVALETPEKQFYIYIHIYTYLFIYKNQQIFV